MRVFALTLVLLFGVSASQLVAALPPNFQETTVFSSLNEPTTLQFSPDGRVFVAEKRGVIRIFDGLSDSTPTVFADLRTNVYNFWDRGLLGLALDPEFPTRPYVYALYTYDAAIGGIAPRWGTPNTDSDPCPNPPGATGDGCVVSARLSRLEAAGDVMTGAEQVLITDWCQQYPSHSIGALAFGTDGALYVSGGDGASFTFTDYGQDGNPRNPCGDPPGGVGASLSPPTAEGGALRSQDLETSGDPVGLNGAILRVDPDTGDALPDNPLASDSDPNARRIVAHGLRNPFRFTIRPGTNEVWIGDVGWGGWEEINRIVNPISAVLNLGWPCYEGNGRQVGYDDADLDICENLYSALGSVTAPTYAYNHVDTVVPGETCPTGSSSISGLAFYSGGSYPTGYNGALFFADHSRSCIWVMFNPPGSTSTAPALVAAYGFNEGAGTTAGDGSGSGHTGTITGATWTTAGRFGNALSFDGVNDWVTVADSSLLDLAGLSGGMTLSAWVNPTALSGYRTVMMKEQSGGLAYSLYAHDNAPRPATTVNTDGVDTSAIGSAALPLNTWTHLAATYDGATLRLYVNGSEVGSQPLGGSIASSALPLRIGGNSVWGEYFAGKIDEVRIYNVALDGGEVQADLSSSTPLSLTSPAPTTIESFAAGAANPVDLKTGPAGDLFYADFDGGAIRRVQYTGAANQPPTAVAQANPSSGPPPLTVAFDGTGSSDPNPADTISHAWDLDGDGQYDDAATAAPSFTYTVAGAYTVRLRVTDNHGASSISSPLVITVGSPGNPPTATITAPASTATWKVNDVISFSGQGTDPEDGVLPAPALSWQIIIHHCPSTCHTHPLQSFPGVTGGSFDAPDHDYPTHLEIRLTVTDSSGAQDSDSVLINPQTVQLQFQTNPSGLQLTVGPSSGATPFSRTVIVGSNNSLSAPSPQALGGTGYAFSSWSDGGAQTHNVVAGSSPATYTAIYTVSGPSGLVVALGFNEGSGTTAGDASGSSHTGAITGATWTPTGRYGNALSFDGTNDWVTVADAADLDLTTGMTAEAWVNPTVLNGWRNAMLKERPGGLAYGLYAHDNTPPRPAATINTGGPDRSATGSSTLPLNTWTHLAATYDGTTLRLYVNGNQVGTQSVSGAMLTSGLPLRIGGNAVWGEYFSGRIDEVRLYNRALTQSQIQTDMNAPIGGGGSPDTSPPTNPANLSATAAGSTQIDLAWTGSTDNVGVSVYQVERCQGTGCTAFGQIATPSATSLSDTGLGAATTYRYRVRAADAAGNLSGYSNVANATTQPSSAPPGLVAAYSFNEGTGSSAADASGNAHPGTISGATWTAAGRFGNGLSFDGTNDWVTVADAADLDLTTGMTLEAWVHPTALSSWRTAILKEQLNGLAYGLYAHDNAPPRPAAYVNTGGTDQAATGGSALSLNTWTHLAATYNGTTLLLYVNGTQIASKSVTGAMVASGQPLRIGGNAVWGEYFAGRIDEVRIYDRALTGTEIQADMGTPVP